MHTTIPAEPSSFWGLEKHPVHRSALASASGKIDLLIIGDSLAELWPRELWKPWSVLNLGVSADRTQDLLWRISDLPLDILVVARVLLVIGTNNIGSGDRPDEVYEGIVACAELLSRTLPAAEIFVFQPPPRGADFRQFADLMAEINHRLAQRFGGRSINVDREITCGYRASCANYCGDGTHFTPLGYQRLTQLLCDGLGWRLPKV